MRFRDDIFDDFQELTRLDHRDGNLYGLEKLWAYLRHRPDKASRPLAVLPDLQRALSQYHTLDDFHVDLAPNKVRDAGPRPTRTVRAPALAHAHVQSLPSFFFFFLGRAQLGGTRPEAAG